MSKALTIVFVLFAGISSYAQQTVTAGEKPLDLATIHTKLVVRSKIRGSIAEINKRLIAEIERRYVGFKLTPEEKESLKAMGANQLLLQAIDHNFSKQIRLPAAVIGEATRIYTLITDNYANVREPHITTAIDAAHEFLKLYESEPQLTEQVSWVKHILKMLEERKRASMTVEYD